MAHRGVQLDQETFSCSFCLDLLNDPVTIPCGHSYCMNCIKAHWDDRAQKKTHSCPLCRQTFKPRPVLVKNTMLAALVEQLRKTGLQAAPAGHCYAGSNTVSAAAGRTERQRELEVSRQNIQQRIQDREKDVKVLQQEVEVINRSADKAVEDSEKIFTDLIRLMEKRCSDVKQQVRSQQETELSRVKELQEKLEQEITDLKRTDAELEQLTHYEYHSQFLHNYPSLSPLSQSTDSSSINIRPLRYFEDVRAAVSKIRDQIQDILSEKWTNISLTGVDVVLSEPEPQTRPEFLKYSCDMTLDPNTANKRLLLSEGNRKATKMSAEQPYSNHPTRFTGWCQVLSKESLTGRCYWEVEMSGSWTDFSVAVTYMNICRTGWSNECKFGLNCNSWALKCENEKYEFYYNDAKILVSGPPSSRVGVYLDRRAGILSFHSVSETMTLLHRIQTTFTQPLYAGLGIYSGESAAFCEPK